MTTPIVVAIGGNSLIRAGQGGSVPEQFENALVTGRHIASLAAQGRSLIITHGNGPQVGAQLIRSELASSQVYALPLDSCDASTQGELGYILQNAMRTALYERGLHVPVVTILTQIVVDRDDPAFGNPTKPVGPFYSRRVAEERERAQGWTMVEDASRGYRRVVASPRPLEIIELDAIAHCLHGGMIVIAAGGGGIPVVRENGCCRGIEAVIDKDRASALLARQIGAKQLVISTDTDYVYLNYKKPDQRALERVTLEEACSYLHANQFLAGSIGPKVEAAVDFLQGGGEEAVITRPDLLSAALEGRAGTHIVAER